MELKEGAKFDAGKVRIDLIPPEAIFALATILTFGANKYTIKYETEWDRLLSVPDVVKIEITTPKECVVSVTKITSEKLILNSLNDKDKIVGIGKNEIQTKLKNTPDVGQLIQNLVQEIKEQNGLVFLDDMELLKKNTTTTVQKVVSSAEAETIFTLTIVTKQGNLGVSFAHDVIMDLDFWEIIWKDLKEQLNILKPLNSSGERNWEKGMKWGRVFGALNRHIWCWWGGQGPTTKNFLFGDLDDETKHSHLWHALCCIVFLVTYEERNIGEDDRLKG